MAKSDFSEETQRALLYLLDNGPMMAAIAEVLSVECKDHKDRAHREAMSPNPSLAIIIKHEAHVEAWSQFVELIRKVAGV